MNSVNLHLDLIDGSKANLNCNSVPILCWDFHYESLNDLKIYSSDAKKIKNISRQFKWNITDLNINDRLKNQVVLITDLEQKIVFASEGIYAMSGYTEKEVLGKKPKMFQGPMTSALVLREIRGAIEKQIPFEKTILNYKKSGETYVCNIQGFPVFNISGKISHFIAFEKAA
ncbi:histidine kinase [Flavobacterium cheongpyeongense]|jgi:PAS domain S-box-containing protein|uniref:Histidine kinase n=1 Tax=Flavobacterium cheongpyeongense TaxID=2212651 RepID=A0A2V4BSX5_9FLAO|nr:PAS domain-containing protein [Flavobacterium cheongpyeongense]PXY41737.1 histidine kinase [Flavobacterium cheongpyeongense]